MPAAPFVLWCLLMPPRAAMYSGLKTPLTLYHVALCADTEVQCEQERELRRPMCQNPAVPCVFDDQTRCMRSDDPRLHVDRRQRTELAHVVTTAFLSKVVHMTAADRHAELQKYGITEQEYEGAIGMSQGDAEQELGRTLELPSNKP
jgi:hypothetical protein